MRCSALLGDQDSSARTLQDAESRGWNFIDLLKMKKSGAACAGLLATLRVKPAT
jgi:hypothetical protein